MNRLPIGHPRMSNGYVIVIMPEHPRANKGCVPQHVLVAEKAIGRFLPSKHPVHHHNRNRADNANTNLVICENHAYHLLLHKRARIVFAGGDPDVHKICSICKCMKLLTEFGSDNYNPDGVNNKCSRCENLAYEAKKNKRLALLEEK